MCARVLGSIVWLAPLLWVAVAAANPDVRLIEAVRNQDERAVRTLLEQNADVNASQPDGATALHWALHWDDLATAELLIRAGANTNAANDYGVTPLSLACSNGSAAGVTLLLKGGADPNVALPTGESPLMTAARTGDLDAATALLSYGADLNATELAQEQTALMWAISEKHPEVARLLIEYGADVHARSKRGVTPLLLAARQGDLDSARLLIANGADVNLAGSDRLSPLVVATVRDHAAVATFLLQQGADPNAEAGYAPLHWAVGRWETELTGPLGILTERDEEWSALRGVRAGKLELVKALLAHGANPNARIAKPPQRVGFTRGGLNLVGATPFVVAAAAGDAGLMKVLASSGADPLLATKENTTALMAAAGVGRVSAESSVTESQALEAVKVALEMGGDVNAANDAGDTALHGAATMRSDAIVKLLADRGARVNVKNKRGQTPLMNARGSSTAELLRTLGADDPVPR